MHKYVSTQDGYIKYLICELILFIYLFVYCAEINIDYSAQILLLKLLQKFSKEDESITKRFHSLITDGKNEYLYESMFVINCLYCPLLSRESFRMKRSLGTSMRSLTILCIIISLALFLRCFNSGKLSELGMSVTLEEFEKLLRQNLAALLCTD